MSFFAELKRRNVFRVGIAYIVAGWLLLQLTDVLSELLDLPDVVGRTIVLVVAIGLPLALFFAWAFELTPEGVKKEKDVDREASITPRTAQKLNMAIGVLLVIALAYIAYDKLFIETVDTPDVTETSALEDELSASEAASELTEQEQEPVDTQKSIVVLPFVNMSNDPEQEFFSDGLSEELLNVLAQIKDLRVISRTSAFAFKGKDVDIPTIAEQLNVSHVLEGSVRKAGGDIRITAQLIEVKTDSHLWSDAYNRKLENVFEIQEEISKAIAAELQVTLGTSGNTSKPTESLEAWQLFLRGRHLYQNRGKAQLERAIELLKQAVDLDPDFAEAWANLAAANVVNGYSEEEGYSDFYREGKLAASRAIGIDPDNGFAHAVLGLVHMSELNWDESMRELDLAIQLNPSETNSLLWKGISLIALGYVDQASAMFEQAERLDPVFTNVHNWLASPYRVKGDVENMRRHISKLQRLDPDFPLDSFINFAPSSSDLDTAEELMRAEEVRTLGSDILAVAAFSALRDSSRKEEAVRTLLANESLASASGLAPYLWKIGAIDETIASFHQLSERGRGLRAISSLQIFWDDFNRQQLSDPAVTEFFDSVGMVAYWRKHGDPDYCRVDGANIECAGP